MSCLLRPTLRQRSPVCPSCRDILPPIARVSHSSSQLGARFASTPSGPGRQNGEGRPSTLFKKLFPDITKDSGRPDDEKGGVAASPDPDGVPIHFHPGRDGLKKLQNGDKLKLSHASRLRIASERGTLWVEKRKERMGTESLRAWLESQVEEEAAPQEAEAEAPTKTPVVLIMFNASKSLTESDFHRLVRQNPHLEGWNSQLERGELRIPSHAKGGSSLLTDRTQSPKPTTATASSRSAATFCTSTR